MSEREEERHERNPFDKDQMPELYGIWLDGWDSYGEEEAIPPDYAFDSVEERNAWISGFQAAREAKSS